VVNGGPRAARLRSRPRRRHRHHADGRLHVGADIHGETGLDGPAFGEPTVQAETVDAIEFMRQVIMEPGRPVTLIATGPLTNVAALMLAPTPGAPPSSTCTR
jgi:inosine-uridine nucleoside N-ribohydrolase